MAWLLRTYIRVWSIILVMSSVERNKCVCKGPSKKFILFDYTRSTTKTYFGGKLQNVAYRKNRHGRVCFKDFLRGFSGAMPGTHSVPFTTLQQRWEGKLLICLRYTLLVTLAKISWRFSPCLGFCWRISRCNFLLYAEAARFNVFWMGIVVFKYWQSLSCITVLVQTWFHNFASVILLYKVLKLKLLIFVMIKHSGFSYR